MPLAAFIAASGFLSARIKSIVKQHHWPVVMLSPDEVSLSEVSAKTPELYMEFEPLSVSAAASVVVFS